MWWCNYFWAQYFCTLSKERILKIKTNKPILLPPNPAIFIFILPLTCTTIFQMVKKSCTILMLMTSLFYFLFNPVQLDFHPHHSKLGLLSRSRSPATSSLPNQCPHATWPPSGVWHWWSSTPLETLSSLGFCSTTHCECSFYFPGCSSDYISCFFFCLTSKCWEVPGFGPRPPTLYSLLSHDI